MSREEVREKRSRFGVVASERRRGGVVAREGEGANLSIFFFVFIPAFSLLNSLSFNNSNKYYSYSNLIVRLIKHI